MKKRYAIPALLTPRELDAMWGALADAERAAYAAGASAVVWAKVASVMA